MLTVLSLLYANAAVAYTPATYPVSSAAGDPTVTVNVTHSPTLPDPKQGETVNYTMDFALAQMSEPGVSRSTTITVHADPNAPFNSAPATSDFTLNGAALPGTVEVTREACSTTTCTFTFTGLTDGTLQFKKAATVATDLPPGTLIMASANVKVTSTPVVALTNVSSNFDGTCSGTYTFEQRVDGSGAWLADVKFADVAGQSKVYLTPDGSTQVLAWNDPAAEGDTIRFTKADGTDITAEVMAKTIYLANDPSTPLYIGLDPAMQTKFQGADWLDSLNWPYDPATWTGNTWLDAGTTITVTREVTYTACLPGGITGDGDTAREFGISTQVARASTVVQASDYDAFTMPGTAPPADCKSSMFVTSNMDTNPTSYYRWTPGTSTTSLYTQQTRTDAIAASEDYPTSIFVLGDVIGGALSIYPAAPSATPPPPRPNVNVSWPAGMTGSNH